MKRTDYTHDGYRHGCPPAGRAGVDGYDLDAPLCERATCEACGHKGLRYVPIYRVDWNRSSGNRWAKSYTYRAFAVCPECNHEEEF